MTTGPIRDLLRPAVRRFFAIHARYNEQYRRWKDRFDPSHLTISEPGERLEVSADLFRPHADVAVILAAGASNIANEGDPHGCFEPERGVYNFNFLNGRCYVARDPLLGATMARSNVLTRLGDRLVSSGAYQRVLLVPVSYGGTYIAEWTPGGRMYPRLYRALKMLHRAKLNLTHVLWQQGEAEANQPCSEIDGQLWIKSFGTVVNDIRTHNVTAPIYVALATICRGSFSETIRKAQQSVVRPGNGIFPGPDLDTIGLDQRWDGCHFSIQGMDRAAELWFEAICGRPAGRSPRAAN
jgi:hypothetical protein